MDTRIRILLDRRSVTTEKILDTVIRPRTTGLSLKELINLTLDIPVNRQTLLFNSTIVNDSDLVFNLLNNHPGGTFTIESLYVRAVNVNVMINYSSGSWESTVPITEGMYPINLYKGSENRNLTFYLDRGGNKIQLDPNSPLSMYNIQDGDTIEIDLDKQPTQGRIAVQLWSRNVNTRTDYTVDIDRPLSELAATIGRDYGGRNSQLILEGRTIDLTKSYNDYNLSRYGTIHAIVEY